jgi:hypothetical protein
VKGAAKTPKNSNRNKRESGNTKSYTMKPPTNEHEFQALCHAWLMKEYPNILSFSIPNGARLHKEHLKDKHGNLLYDKEGNAIYGNKEIGKLKKEGLLNGAADYMIAKPSKGYHGLFIEFKVGKNTQRDTQVEFEVKATDNGYLYLVIYDNRKDLNSDKAINPLQYFQVAVIDYLDCI